MLNYGLIQLPIVNARGQTEDGTNCSGTQPKKTNMKLSQASIFKKGVGMHEQNKSTSKMSRRKTLGGLLLAVVNLNITQ